MTGDVEWIGTEEVARELGMTPDWVRAQIRAKRLKARVWHTGSRSTIRIRRTDLEEFIRRHSSG
jgi:excisionase family DNA binding protein